MRGSCNAAAQGIRLCRGFRDVQLAEDGDVRHLVGIVLAIVMAGVLFFAGAWGYLRLLRLPVTVVPLSRLPADGGSLLSDHSVLAALIAVACTGMLAGILIARRGFHRSPPGCPDCSCSAGRHCTWSASGTRST
jgi:hypothetical protein